MLVPALNEHEELSPPPLPRAGLFLQKPWKSWLSSQSYLTVKALTSVLEPPSGLVTVTSRTDLKALLDTMTVAISLVLETYLVMIVSPKPSMLILDWGVNPLPITMSVIRSPGEAELG